MSRMAWPVCRCPAHRPHDILTALRRGRAFVLSIQRPEGSWYGSWGVCFTYGTWFGCKALRATGDTAARSAAQRAALEFLLSKQQDDGGWGESYLSCQDKAYSQLPGAIVSAAAL